MTGRRDALIVGAAPVAGASEHYARVIAGADLLIAADAGLLLCRAAGRTPDICVGDFDSTPPGALAEAEAAGARVLRYPADKDESDLDLALSAARASGAGRVRFAAAFAGRLDHTLAALGTMLAAADLEAECSEPEWTGYALSGEGRAHLRLAEPEGTVISLISPAGAARVTAEGFVYPLRDATIAPLSSLGLSNVASCAIQTVRVLSGGVLVIVNRAGSPTALQSGLDWTDTL